MNSFLFICQILITTATISVFVAVIVDFKRYNHREDTVKSQRSIVATSTMVGFYVILYVLLRFKIGTVNTGTNDLFRIAVGTILIVIGAVVNILGRIQLGQNWANHVKIYEDHAFVNYGVYQYVRHPLYASIILMLLAACLALENLLGLLLTIGIFIPMMNFRAKQEEVLLIKTFEDEYQRYTKETGRFIPKFKEGNKHGKI
jgi:protein-S-isoprenylcysteine O-methyltransferase Ste14